MPEYKSTTKPLPKLTKQDRERFWKFVDKRGRNECWPWKGGRSPKGYGQFKVGARGKQRTVIASRVAYMIRYGKDPHPNLILHKCDNPPCCHWRHTIKGTQLENLLDAKKKGRTLSGDRNPAHLHPELLPRGADHWTAKNPEKTHRVHDEEHVLAVRKLHQLRPELSLRALARYFGLPLGTVRQIVQYVTHKHLVERDVTIPPPKDENYIAIRSLRPEDHQTIRELKANGLSQSQIAVRLNISQPYVGRILRDDANSL